MTHPKLMACKRTAGAGIVLAAGVLLSGCVLHVDGDGDRGRGSGGGWRGWQDGDGDRCEARDTVELRSAASDTLAVHSGPGGVVIQGDAELSEVVVAATPAAGCACRRRPPSGWMTAPARSASPMWGR